MKGIPDNITFYCQNLPQKTVNEITGEDYGFVLPAWAKDTKGKNDAALNWAKNIYRRDDNNSIKPCRVVTVPNNDIFDIAITDISYRGAGAKVFKALVYDMFLIDISAECLFEVLSCGKIEDGRIKSPMFFGTANNKMSLILRDGKFHKDILFRNLPDIKEKNLKKYQVYENLSIKAIYLSKVNTVRLSFNCDTVYDRLRGNYVKSNLQICCKRSVNFVSFYKYDKNVNPLNFLNKDKSLSYNSPNITKTFNYKLEGMNVTESYFEKWIEEVESFDFFSIKLEDNYYQIQSIYNTIAGIEYTPKSESLKRLIAWVDSLTENWSSNFQL